jgi:branched-chain amino acid transport system ATP-binding protein
MHAVQGDPTPPGPILKTEAVGRFYGNFVAVADVSFALTVGEIKALIGPNGAGKTTLFNMMSGQMPPSSGRILYKGQDITGFPANVLAHLGIGRSFQVTSVFRKLSVLQNVEIAVQARRHPRLDVFSSASRLEHVRNRAEEILALVGLSRFLAQQAGSLSHGDQRRLEIGIVLATDPELILLDEPTAGMSREDSAEFALLLPKLAKDKTVLFVEHNIDFVMNNAQRIVVMERGRILLEGTPAEIRASEEVRRVYLGSLHD